MLLSLVIVASLFTSFVTALAAPASSLFPRDNVEDCYSHVECGEIVSKGVESSDKEVCCVWN
jgi:hypothetical protein